MSNNKAKLTYPVALATYEELFTLTNNNSSTYYSVLTKTNANWWGLSPLSFNYNNAFVHYVSSTGYVGTGYYVNLNCGVRLVVSLKNGITISRGTGSETDPWVIE